MRNLFLSCLAAAALLTLPAYGQDDSQSLGDAARQARSQKQQRDAPAKSAQEKSSQDQSGQGQNALDKTTPAKSKQSSKAPKVITDDEISSHTASAALEKTDQGKAADDTSEKADTWKAPAEDWKNQIAQMKSSIEEMKAQIDQLNDSIHYTSGNCVAGCAEWNERQQGKQQQVETMKAQLEDQQKRLEAMQEAARQQGYGSSVYDP
jgi:chromosome segregation ATPase